MSNIPDGITAQDVRSAIGDFVAGTVEHSFHESEKYDLLFEGNRYPPKAILGIAARRVAGRILRWSDFGGGKGSRCFNVLMNLGFEIVSKPDQGEQEGSDWTNGEIDAALSAYLQMLRAEVAGKPFNKAETNRSLRNGALAKRSRGSVEYRMANISAVLKNLNRRWIKGYKPAVNVGSNVEERILDSLTRLEAINRDDLTPEADPQVFEQKVRKARLIPLTQKPTGSTEPKRVARLTEQFERDPAVKAWVLEHANGVCELCGQPAPFNDDNGLPFLEVHHVKPLAEQGADTVENALALCPNCHRRCHHSHDRHTAIPDLYRKITRLVRVQSASHRISK